MKKDDCPCWTCLVRATCKGAEPTKEQMRKIMFDYEEFSKTNECKTLNDRHIPVDGWPEDGEYLIDPSFEAQSECPMYMEWAGWYYKEDGELILPDIERGGYIDGLK